MHPKIRIITSDKETSNKLISPVISPSIPLTIKQIDHTLSLFIIITRQLHRLMDFLWLNIPIQLI